jgi:membrane protease YdiL (CAAX protease family)
MITDPDRPDRRYSRGRGIPGSSAGEGDIYLRPLAAILLLVGCMLLQIPIHLAAEPFLGKNLAVAAAILLGIFLPAVAAVLWISPRPEKTLRLGILSASEAVSVAGVSLSFAMLAGGFFEWLLRSERIPPTLVELLEREEMLFREIFRLESGSDLLVVAMVLIVIAPLAEELLFRGIFQGSLERAIGHWPGILITALSFGILHGRVRFIPVSLLGLLMGYMVMRTNALTAGLAAHSINNLTILFLSQLFAWHTASPNLPLYTAIAGGIGLPVFLSRFRSLTENRRRLSRPGSPDIPLPSSPP